MYTGSNQVLWRDWVLYQIIVIEKKLIHIVHSFNKIKAKLFTLFINMDNSFHLPQNMIILVTEC